MFRKTTRAPAPANPLGTIQPSKADSPSSKSSSPAFTATNRQTAAGWIGAANHVGFVGHQGRKVSDQELHAAAKKAQAGAIVPVSGFSVGAAAVTKSGRIITGANLETNDRSGGGGTCAENNVLFQLRGEELDTIVISSDSPICITPCGGCCQSLSDIAPPTARVVMTSSTGEMKVTTVAELMGLATALATAEQLAPHAKAIGAAKTTFAKAEPGSGNIKPHGVVVADKDGSMHRGATRKQSGAYSRAMQMANDARFMADPSSPVQAIVFAGHGEGPMDVPSPSGRDRQEMFNVGPNVPVVLLNVTTGVAVLTTPQDLLPLAYVRS